MEANGQRESDAIHFSTTRYSWRRRDRQRRQASTTWRERLNNSSFTIIVFAMIAAVTVSAGGQAIQPVVDTSRPDQAYRVEWEETHTPTEVAARITIAVPVTVRNSGNRIWPSSEVFVAYHWLRDGRLVVWDGERTPF